MGRSSLPAVLIFLLLALVWNASARGQDRDTTWVMTFDHDFYNWATPHIQTFEFPAGGQSWSQILLFYTIECPESPGDCDPWDRLGHIRVVTEDSTAGEVHYEIARIVTPYDITGSGYPGSCTWIIDVSDYETLLQGSVTLRSYIESWIGGDRGWIVTARFGFVPGDKELMPYRITNLWASDYLVFGDPSRPIEDVLIPLDVALDADAVAFKVVAAVTGHGQGNTDNAAEFARKWHEVVANGTAYGHYLWRANCANNVCSPQRGTWYYSRAGWCPGKDVRPWSADITPSVTPGTVISIDYDIEAYENFCRPNNPACQDGVTCGDCDYNYEGHTEPNFCFNAQLIHYRQIPSEVAGDFGPSADRLELAACRPNPFVGSTVIPYRLSAAGVVTISICAPDGRMIRALSRRHAAGGEFACRWDGRDEDGRVAAAGIYFYTLRAAGEAEGTAETRKMIRLQ
ncbi:MAG: peptide-N-glycosidase F-related protein [Candidatus Eisenbacteria bacterium]